MSSQRHIWVFIALGLLLIGTRTAFANPPLPPQTIARGKVASSKILFKPPANDKRPNRTVGAGSRGGQCPQDLAPAPVSSEMPNLLTMMALVPPSNNGLTVSERPTFWMYLPQTSAKQVVLTLQKEDASSHSQWVFPVPSTAGVVGLQPPADAPPLKIGETYQWAVVLVCGDRPNPNDPAIAAWVQRVSPSQSVPQSTALDLASWNGAQGLWYDMLTALSQARLTKPTNPDLADVWANVLKSEGLEIVALEPLRHE